MSAVLKPVIEMGVIREIRQYRQTSGSKTFFLNPEAAQYSDAALVHWCDGDNHRWGSTVTRYPNEVVVSIEKN